MKEGARILKCLPRDIHPLLLPEKKPSRQNGVGGVYDLSFWRFFPPIFWSVFVKSGQFADSDIGQLCPLQRYKMRGNPVKNWTFGPQCAVCPFRGQSWKNPAEKKLCFQEMLHNLAKKNQKTNRTKCRITGVYIFGDTLAEWVA